MPIPYVMDHRVNDRIGWRLAAAVAAELPRRPEWIALARENLDRWERRNAESPGLIRCYREWRGILNRPVDEVRATLMRDDDEGQRLRQNSPFAGALSPRDVWRIKQEARDETRAS